MRSVILSVTRCMFFVSGRGACGVVTRALYQGTYVAVKATDVQREILDAEQTAQERCEQAEIRDLMRAF